MKNKKVLIISSLNTWNDIRIYKKEARSLSEKYNVKYICAGETDELKNIDNISFSILRKPEGIIERLYHLKKISRIISKDNASIYHLHNPELLLIVPKIKRLHPNAKIIFDMHEDFEEAIKDKQWLPKGIRNITSKLYRLYLNKLLKSKLDFTIVTTPLIKEKFPSVKKIEVIENFAPLMEKIPSSEVVPRSIQNCINQNIDKTKIVFTGLINKQRGILQVIEAVKQIEDTVFIMIGICSHKFLEELNQIIKNDGIENKVYIFESVEYDQMLASMAQMDIGILPYLPYGNHVVTRPNKLFEYMMTSLPVISSNFPLYEEIVNDGIGISVNPMKVEAIIEAIKIIAKSKNNRERMGNRGFKLYSEKYNWSVEEKKLYKIYEELLGE